MNNLANLQDLNDVFASIQNQMMLNAFVILKNIDP